MMESPEWMTRALCADSDVDFFPETGVGAAKAILVCRSCPVIRDCYQFAMDESYWTTGIWGGTSHKERLMIRRKRRPAPVFAA